jgi:uncharacterized membrane protein
MRVFFGSRYPTLLPLLHPMVVHFPIALVYLTLLTDVAALVTRGERRAFLTRAGWWLLTATCVAIVAAMVAGVVAEHSVRLTPQDQALLSRHKAYAVLTGLCAGAAWLVRLSSFFPREERQRGAWSVLGTGRGQLSVLATALVAAAAVAIALTGNLGGRLVYDHGVGVRAMPGAATVWSRPPAR